MQSIGDMKYNDAVIQSLIVDTGEDAFRRVLSFLAPGIKSLISAWSINQGALTKHSLLYVSRGHIAT